MKLDAVLTLAIITTTMWIVAFTLMLQRARRAERELARVNHERATLTAQALVGAVTIDGVPLPLPTDERWLFNCMKVVRHHLAGRPVYAEDVLSIGDIHASRTQLYIGNAEGLFDKVHQKYIDAVWHAYRARIAKKSIEQ